MAIPGYMPQNDYGTLTEDFEGLPVYEKHGDLRRKVSNYFHHDNKTEDKGIWYENTHCAKLSFAGKKRAHCRPFLLLSHPLVFYKLVK